MGRNHGGINDNFDSSVSAGDPQYGARMKDRERSRPRQRPISIRSGSSEFEG